LGGGGPGGGVKASITVVVVSVKAGSFEMGEVVKDASLGFLMEKNGAQRLN
jgi:hypothetical protein